MYYTKMRLENEAYQRRVDSAWEQRERAQDMARFAVPDKEEAEKYIAEQMIRFKEASK